MSEAETAYAKLNLALHVRGRRDDGYHDIETVFAFCEDGDTISGEGFDSERTGFSLSVAGPFGTGLSAGDPNLVEKAWAALTSATGDARQSFLRLDKQLPIAAGIGGGSADAAATLRLLNRLWNLDWPLERFDAIASELGADVPACLHSRTARGSGRGDVVEPVDLGLAGQPVLLVNPRVELSTADVFARWDGVDRGPLDDWRNGRNDLQEAAMSIVPQIRAIVAWLSVHDGVQLVRMSGSGATCFAVFESDEQCQRVADAVPREWWRLATRLR